MDTKANGWLLFVFGIFAVLGAVVYPGSLSAQDYVYSDDFSTDKAMVDSYWHSVFLEELPDPWPVEGFLLYESYISHRTLSFYDGMGNDAYAWLRYRLPLEGGSTEYGSAVVELELVDNWGFGWIQCGCSLEGGAPWEWPVCGEEGSCTFEFTGSVPSDTVYIWLRGGHASIDDLVITLESETPVGEDSWGRIKHLFRGPLGRARRTFSRRWR